MIIMEKLTTETRVIIIKKKKFWTPGTVDLIGTKITRKRDESFTKVCKINI